jgi:hypothetical protein
MSNPIERRPEPEIIPPGQPLPREAVMWVGAGSSRVYSARTGPVSLLLIALAVGVVGALGLIVLLGIAVISLIAGGLLTAAFIIAGILRKPSQPLR